MEKSAVLNRYIVVILLIMSTANAYCQANHELVRNENHVITYKCRNDMIAFRFDCIGDQTDNLDGRWPRLDHVRIWVDFNQNSQIDYLIDRCFSPSDFPDVCKTLMYSQVRLTTCFFDSGATSLESFGTSANSKINHIIFEVKIPKSELSDVIGEASVYFEIFDGNGRSTSYPSPSTLFSYTFKIDCNQISI